MVEAEWLTTKMPLYMLREGLTAWNERKACMFSCINLWRAGDHLDREQTESSTSAGECFAEVELGEIFNALGLALNRFNAGARNRHQAEYLPDGWVIGSFFSTLPRSLMDLVGEITHRVALAATGNLNASGRVYSEAETAEKARQCDLIREIFGNPFSPISFNPAWLTSDVLALAVNMYDSRDFSAMPILADALQDAGCDNVNVLDHCREPGKHVRGCWVIDLILGKG